MNQMKNVGRNHKKISWQAMLAIKKKANASNF